MAKEIKITAKSYEAKEKFANYDANVNNKEYIANAKIQDVKSGDKYDEIAVVMADQLSHYIQNSFSPLFKYLETSFKPYDISSFEKMPGLGTLIDGPVITEQIYLSLNKQAVDYFGTDDFVNKSIDKGLRDTFTRLERVAKELHKSNVSEYDMLSILTKEAYKSLADIVLTNDSLTRVFFKSLVDTFETSDDIFGEVSVDDDQSMVFFKLLQHTAHHNDVLTRTVEFYRSFVDTATVSDNLEIVFDKSVSDNFNTDDEISKDAYKALSDSFSNTESIVSKNFSKNIENDVFYSDTIGKEIYKTFTETLDIYQLFSLYRLVTRDEANEYLATNDLATLLVQKNQRDDLDLNESGEVYVQSYFAEDYCEKGYTGVFVNF